MRHFLILLLGCLIALTLRTSAPAGAHPALAGLPAKLVWAWERPEDLRWLPHDVGVAYVASSIYLRGEEALVHPRSAPLLVKESTAQIPVLHVDASWRTPPTLSEQQTQRIAQELLRVAARANRQVVQLDFEVRRSQRPFLAATIATIRRRLDARIALSVTALASWCMDDNWMGGSEADEIVPMAFRMGAQSDALRQRLQQQRGFAPRECRSAIGFSSDEPRMPVRAARQYYFSPQPWTAMRWQAIASSLSSTIASQ
jgi:hypothetical protein